MNIIFGCLLLSSHSIIIAETTSVSQINSEISKLLTKRESCLIAHNLKLLKNGKIGQTDHALVWKGIFNNIQVAAKIVPDKRSINAEMEVFEALNATKNPNIEAFGIPRIHFCGAIFRGAIFRGYHVIAMTLFDETLEDRYEHQNKNLSDLSILLILKRAVEILRFIHSKNVIHNDIKPQNIFLRGSEVFISDFDLSALKGREDDDSFATELFASSNYFQNEDRHPMDDIQSLVFSMWYVAGIPMSRSPNEEPEGSILSDCIENGEAKSRMMEKCGHFTNENVRGAFELICVEEMISGQEIPNYSKIINVLTQAIANVSEKPGQMRFEWLTECSSNFHS